MRGEKIALNNRLHLVLYSSYYTLVLVIVELLQSNFMLFHEFRDEVIVSLHRVYLMTCMLI